jgi:hypothetical protein
MDIKNPYAPSSLTTDESVRLTRWHIVPAAASLGIGAASFGFGLFAVAVMTHALWTHQANETLGGMIAGCSLYLGFGTSWMVAGWYYLTRRFRRGLVATGLGILIPVILFAILGV